MSHSPRLSVHDACEAWSKGHLPLDDALRLTGAANVAELEVTCRWCGVRPMPLLVPPLERTEHWWVDRGGDIVPAEVVFGGALASAQEPPQPWCASVPGSEEVLWPDTVRLIEQISPPRLPPWTEEEGLRFDLAVGMLRNEVGRLSVAVAAAGDDTERDRLRRQRTALVHLRQVLAPRHPAVEAIIARKINSYLAQREAVPVGDLDDEIDALVEAAQVQTGEPYEMRDIPEIDDDDKKSH